MSDPTGMSENMLVKQENLDELLTLAGEVIIASSSIELTYKKLQEIYDRQIPVDREALDSSKDLATSTSILSTNLHHLVQAIRMVDLKDLSFRTRRLVRDISRRTGKRVVFEVHGEDTIVDKTIIEKLYDPISHQLRNAVDHGIEDSLTRERSGKSEEGTVVLRAYNTEKDTFIEIEDDGAGIDMEKLRKVAIEKGLVGADDKFSEADALSVMCAPGVSTTQTVSEVSGRGVGMDVVNRQISEIGGSVSFKTELGKGTTFTLMVPLISAVNILDALVVRAGSTMFAFPISCVVANLFIPKKNVSSTLEKGKMIKYLGNMLPLYNLHYVLDRTATETDGESLPILVIEYKNERIALEISEFFSPQKLVIIPFNNSLDIEGLSGSTILGGRKLGFIIDVPSLINRAFEKETTSTKKEKKLIKKVDLKETAKKIEAEQVKEKTPVEKTVVAAAEEEPEFAVQEFLVEVEKILPSLNKALFGLESDPTSSDNMNEAFRLFHTIKGNIIMMGLPRAGETIHRLESVLDRARAKKLEVSPEVIDVLMDGVSYIEEMIRQSKAGEWEDQPSENILEQSAKLLPEEKAPTKMIEDVFSEEFTFSHEASYRVNYHRKRRIPLYQIYIEFDPGKQPSFLIGCLIYKRLGEVGDVVGCVPNLIDVEKGLLEGKIKLLIASEVDAEVLETSISSLLTKHYGTTVVNFNRFE